MANTRDNNHVPVGVPALTPVHAVTECRCACGCRARHVTNGHPEWRCPDCAHEAQHGPAWTPCLGDERKDPRP